MPSLQRELDLRSEVFFCCSSQSNRSGSHFGYILGSILASKSDNVFNGLSGLVGVVFKSFLFFVHDSYEILSLDAWRDKGAYGLRPTKICFSMLATAPGAQQGRQQRIQHSKEIDAKKIKTNSNVLRLPRRTFQKTSKNCKTFVMAGNTFLMAGNTLVMAGNTLVMAGNTFVMAGAPELFCDRHPFQEETTRILEEARRILDEAP